MLTYQHVFSVIEIEIQNFTPVLMLWGAFYVWITHKAIKNISSPEGKMFWLSFGSFLLYTVLQSTQILMNELLYIASTLIYNHIDILFKYIRRFINKIKIPRLKKHEKKETKNKNLMIENQKKLTYDNETKKKDLAQKEFIENLSKKLDAF